MRSLCPEYSGGHWEFYTLSNGGFYMAPGSELQREYVVECSGNGFRRKVSSNAAGIIACLFALSYMELYDQYEMLLNFASELSESEDIFSAID